MSLSMISFILQCVSVGIAFIIFMCYFIKNLKLKIEAKRTMKALENEKKERELYIKLAKKYESEVVKHEK